MTGERSSITAHSIIAIKGKALAAKGFHQVPPLNNRELFRRDRHMCAYCGGEFNYFRLTRDHIRPLSRGGRDTWMNVVTACRQCNGQKRNRMPEEAGIELLYAPYVPNKAEYLILTNRAHPLRPDGVPQAARGGAFPPGPRPCLISGAIAVFTCSRRDAAGRLRVTDDYLRAYYLRPEVHPVEESCDAERALARGADARIRGAPCRRRNWIRVKDADAQAQLRSRAALSRPAAAGRHASRAATWACSRAAWTSRRCSSTRWRT